MSNNRPDNDIAIPIFFGICIFIAIICGIIFKPEPPPPKPIEQIRNERNERYNEAGKSVNNFIRGAVGLEKTEPVKVPEKSIEKK